MPPNPQHVFDIYLPLFAGSGRWPDDIVAIEKVKVAFYLRIAKLVKQKLKMPTVATMTHVDVFAKPYVFRLVIFAGKELTLASSQLASLNTMVDAAKRQGGDMSDLQASQASSQNIVDEMERFFVHMPALSSYSHSVYLKHTSFSRAVRLAKRWVNTHMFSGIVSDEAVELLVAFLYQHPAPLAPPVFGHVGFLRFLKLLSTFNWKSEPLILDTTELLGAGEVSEMVQRFKEDRSAYPAMTILTPWDKHRSIWTKAGPSPPLLRRMVVFARETEKLLKAHVAAGASLDFGGLPDAKQLFRTSLADYDVLIRLKHSELPRVGERIDHHVEVEQSKKKRTYKNLEGAKKKVADTLPLVDHDPVILYIKDLQQHYGHTATFFYDQLGGDTIGVVWDPQVCCSVVWCGVLCGEVVLSVLFVLNAVLCYNVRALPLSSCAEACLLYSPTATARRHHNYYDCYYFRIVVPQPCAHCDTCAFLFVYICRGSRRTRSKWRSARILGLWSPKPTVQKRCGVLGAATAWP